MVSYTLQVSTYQHGKVDITFAERPICLRVCGDMQYLQTVQFSGHEVLTTVNMLILFFWVFDAMQISR
jgi:hypothetical protein